MHFIRRAALRAATSSSSVVAKPRSLTTTATASPLTLRSRSSNSIASTVFRRFASDETSPADPSPVKSADSDDGGAVRAAIDSAAEATSTHVKDAAEIITNSTEQARDSVVDSAVAAARSLGFSPREERGDAPPRSPRSYAGGRFDQGGSSMFGRGGRDDERAPLRPSPSIYVGNLLFDVTADDLTREFGEFGPIKKAHVVSDARGLSKGFGYIEFEKTEQATAAIDAKHQMVFEGRRMVVNYQAVTRREATYNPPSKTIFIGNLAFEMSDADLNKLFRDIRNVIDVRVAIDRRTGQPRGFAHADFVDVESAKKAFEMLQNKEVYGRRLRLDYSSGASGSLGRGRGAPRADRREESVESSF